MFIFTPNPYNSPISKGGRQDKHFCYHHFIDVGHEVQTGYMNCLVHTAIRPQSPSRIPDFEFFVLCITLSHLSC